MSVVKKLDNIQTHVVDILGSTKGRDQPIMKMDKAVELVKCLDREILESDDYVFFDPFCKAGEILLATALVSNSYKSQSKNKIININDIKEDIYNSNKYFALAPDERHYKLSLRTFYGNENSHKKENMENMRNGNYLSEEDGKLDEEKFNKELASMLEFIKEKSGGKKIIAIGNPPYQEGDGGFGGSASAIYPILTEAVINNFNIKSAVFVIPSRWFTSGKNTEHFRSLILESKKIKKISHYENSKEIFPTVDILGGVCFLEYDSVYNGNIFFKKEKVETEVKNNLDIILDDPFGYALVRKILKNWNKTFVSEEAWSGKPFGLRTFYFKRITSLRGRNSDTVPCYSKRRVILKARKEDISKNKDKIDEWKVAIPRAYAPGSSQGVRRVTLPVNQYFLIPKGHICTETYNIVASFTAKKEAVIFLEYLQTDFARYFLGLRKVTQDIPKDRWKWVPKMDTLKKWTDEELVKYFHLTKSEWEHIQKKVKEWS